MNVNNVSYINMKPYHYSFPIQTMIKRYCSKSNHISQANKSLLEDHMIKQYSRYKYNNKNKNIYEQKLDDIVSKEILRHITNFINNK